MRAGTSSAPSIDRIEDGGTYSFPTVQLVQTGLFLRVGCIGDLFIKVPSIYGFDDYRNFVKRALLNAEDLRSLEDAERWERLDQTLASFPDLKPILRVGSEAAHYLAIHKLQYERLRTQTVVRIPRAKFGVLRSAHRGIFRKLEPALFQEKVSGTTLWDMFDFSSESSRTTLERVLARDLVPPVHVDRFSLGEPHRLEYPEFPFRRSRWLTVLCRHETDPPCVPSEQRD